MTSPKFICIGAQKAGTTWLYDTLSQNPSIWLPPIKEVHYFDSRDAEAEVKEKRKAKFLRMAKAFAKDGLDKGSPGANKADFMTSLAQNDVLSEAWYRRIFSHPDANGRISGEITPSYMVLDEPDIAEVRRVAPDAKIVLLVREPVARALSQMRMMIARSEKVPAAQADWDKLIRQVIKQQRGDYATCVPRWIKAFGENRVGLYPFGDIKSDPAGLVARIETFLGASAHKGYESIEEAVHTTKPIEIPAVVKTRLEEAYKGQKEFLAGLMGADFAARIG